MSEQAGSRFGTTLALPWAHETDHRLQRGIGPRALAERYV
jgi:hypothetical protein